MPESKMLGREVFSKADIRLVDAAGKDKEIFKRVSKPANVPELKPDLKSLVILPLPLRSRDVLNRKYSLLRQLLGGERHWVDLLPSEAALELLASEFAANNAQQVVAARRQCFVNRGDQRLGFFTLLQSCGYDVGTSPEFRETLRKMAASDTVTPLVRYLSLAFSTDANFWQRQAGALPGPKPVDNFLDNLLTFKAILAALAKPNG